MLNLNNQDLIIIALIGLIVIMLFNNLRNNRRIQNVQKIANITNNDSTPKIINFNASWCYWSKKLQPVWDNLTDSMKNKDIEVLDIKCELDENKELCNRYQIEGFPTIKLIVGNNVIDYEGERSYEGLTRFINTNVKY